VALQAQLAVPSARRLYHDDLC